MSEKSLDLNSELHPMPAKCRLHAYSFEEDNHFRIEEWGKAVSEVCMCVCVLQTEPIANGVILSCTHLEQGGSVQG